MSDDDITTAERITRWFKTNPVTSLVLLAAAAIVGVATFTDAVQKLVELPNKLRTDSNAVPETPLGDTPVQPRKDLSVIGITTDRTERGSPQIPKASDGEPGFFVRSVDPNGPAANYGLQPGDFITHLDGIRIKEESDWGPAVAQKPPGTVVEITLWRENKLLKIALPTITSSALEAMRLEAATKRAQADKFNAQLTIRWTNRDGSAVQITDPPERQCECFVFGMPELADGDTWRGVLFPAGLYRYTEREGHTARLKAFATTIDLALKPRRE